MISQWRRLALSKQGLTSQQPFGTGLLATQKAIEHLGYVQIDTLSVVERAHHHVLWNRVPDYHPAHLNQLIKKKRIFEYWHHAASYLPMRDYRYALPHMRSIRNGENRYYNNVDKRLMKEILARVKSDGALRVRDLETPKKNAKSNWWNSGPGRRALDKLFMQGDLMVSERIGMEKVYDLSERCLPNNIDLSTPTLIEYATYLFDTTSRAHGVFTWKQLLHLKTGKFIRNAMREVLNQRIEEGQVQALASPSSPDTYVDIKALGQVEKVSSAVKILSPFDNAVIHRDRLNSLFEFDFRIECYVPAAKRLYGYFCLPILYGDKFVARIDCKAHRADQRLEVLSLHLEKTPFNRDKFFPSLKKALQKFAEFNACLKLEDGVIEKLRSR